MTDREYTKEERLQSMRAAQIIFPYRQVVLRGEERERIIPMLTEHNIVSSDMFHSGMGTGCGAYETYDLNGVRYDLVFPEAAEKKFQVIRFDPIDWDAKIKAVEQED